MIHEFFESKCVRLGKMASILKRIKCAYTIQQSNGDRQHKNNK